MAAPQTVSNIQVVSLLSQRRFLIQWADNPETDIASYSIFRSENQFDGYTKVGSVGLPSTQFVDTVPFTFGVNYFWKVTAVNDSSQESDLSSTEAVSDITIGQFDEEPFKQVTVQKADLVFSETPSGLLNGSNVTYTTAFPFRAGTLQLLKNGLMEVPNGSNPDFIELSTGTGLTVAIAPLNTDTLRVNYVKYFS